MKAEFRRFLDEGDGSSLLAASYDISRDSDGWIDCGFRISNGGETVGVGSLFLDEEDDVKAMVGNALKTVDNLIEALERFKGSVQAVLDDEDA